MGREHIVDTGFPQPVVFTGKKYQMAVVHQPPYKRGGHLLIIQDIYPSGKLQIGIKDNDFLFMDLGKIVKQQLGTGPVVRDIRDTCSNELIEKQYSNMIQMYRNGDYTKEEAEASIQSLDHYRRLLLSIGGGA